MDEASEAFRHDTDTLHWRPVRESSGYTCTQQASAVAAVIMGASREILGKEIYTVPVVHRWENKKDRHAVAFVPEMRWFVEPMNYKRVFSVEDYINKKGKPYDFKWLVFPNGNELSEEVDFDPRDTSTYQEKEIWCKNALS